MGYKTTKIIQLKDIVDEYGDYFVDESKLMKILMEPFFYFAKTAVESANEKYAAEERRKEFTKELVEHLRKNYY